MFQQIMARFDLEHLDRLERALQVTAEEALGHDAEVTFGSVTAATPGPLAHNPDEYRGKLEEFAKSQESARGMSAPAHVVVSHDPTTDLDDALLAAVEEISADLVIMATHKRGDAEFFRPSNGGKVASHSGASVFLVRDA